MKNLFAPAVLGETVSTGELFAQLTTWYTAASQKNAFYRLLERVYPSLAIHMPDAISLATATADGKPSARMVLYKGQTSLPDGRQGLVFYTNYDSRKGKELHENPFAAVVFHWPLRVQQVRIEGAVVRAPEGLSDRYWNSRARGSQISGTASPQSQEIESFEWLQKQAALVEKKHSGQVADNTGNLPRPKNWGGYILIPSRFEFWQGHAFRLHERAAFVPVDASRETHGWKKLLLAP